MVIWRISDEVSARLRKTQDKDTEKTLGTGSTSRNIWMIFISDRRMQYIFIAQIFFLFISPYKTLFPQYITSCPSLHSQLQEPLIRAKFISIAGQEELKIASVTGGWAVAASDEQKPGTKEQWANVILSQGSVSRRRVRWPLHTTWYSPELSAQLFFSRSDQTSEADSHADKSFRMEPSRPSLLQPILCHFYVWGTRWWVEAGYL